ncbi:hypothetical protein L484_025538 [Morus notabilis]|uniref:Uncharacterized protein n=1 Tax=Morus notabilis TaxID=981085 RepID=W9RX04_9ROSA|nr:hypothetical protein L484_025538 [Morus notabilis]
MVGHLGELSLSSTALAISLSGVTGFSLLNLRFLDPRIMDSWVFAYLSPTTWKRVQQLIHHCRFAHGEISMCEQFSSLNEFACFLIVNGPHAF